MALKPYFLFDPGTLINEGEDIPDNVLDDIERLWDNNDLRLQEIKRWDPLDGPNYPNLARYIENNNGGGMVPVLITWW